MISWDTFWIAYFIAAVLLVVPFARFLRSTEDFKYDNESLVFACFFGMGMALFWPVCLAIRLIYTKLKGEESHDG